MDGLLETVVDITSYSLPYTRRSCINRISHCLIRKVCKYCVHKLQTPRSACEYLMDVGISLDYRAVAASQVSQVSQVST